MTRQYPAQCMETLYTDIYVAADIIPPRDFLARCVSCMQLGSHNLLELFKHRV